MLSEDTQPGTSVSSRGPTTPSKPSVDSITRQDTVPGTRLDTVPSNYYKSRQETQMIPRVLDESDFSLPLRRKTSNLYWAALFFGVAVIIVFLILIIGEML